MKGNTGKEKLLKIAYGIVRIVGIGMFLLLSGAGLISSQYMLPGTEELPINKGDSCISNLLAVGVAVLVVIGIRMVSTALSDKALKNVERIVLTVATLWIGGLGLLWNMTLERVPEGDQAFIYGAASYFLEGNYSFLEKGGYCQLYPQQLGLIALTELLFAVVGTYQYFAFQVICVIMAMGIVLLGHALLKELQAGVEIRMFYCVLMMGCLPLIFYTSWVYGDIPSIFFAMAVALFFAKMMKKPKWYHSVGVVACSVLAMLVRKNSLILLVAMGLLAIVYVPKNKKWQVPLTVLCVYLASFLSYQGITMMYENRSGQEISEGLPISSWIAMGMQEHRGVCGWYNNMPKEVAEACNWDFDATKERVDQVMKERLNEFIHNPAYAAGFYGKKLLTQWNAPLYQSVYFSAKYEGEDEPMSGGFLEKLYHTQEGYFSVFSVADRWQFVIYVGMLLYFLLEVKKKEQPFVYLLAVTILGGFFFSILWEAKARYCFPYYLMMYPLAAMGYGGLLQLKTEKVNHKGKKQKK